MKIFRFYNLRTSFIHTEDRLIKLGFVTPNIKNPGLMINIVSFFVRKKSKKKNECQTRITPIDKITKCCTDFVINILESLEIEEEIKKRPN